MKISGQQRKAISPIVATVLIIAATLIAAAAILGYVFGIFGGASNTANVSVTSVTISATGTQGTWVLSNSGTLSVNTLTTGAISLSYQGKSCTLAITAAVSVPAGSSASVQNTAVTTAGQFCGTTAAVAGNAFTGSVALANGESASFSGTFSS